MKRLFILKFTLSVSLLLIGLCQISAQTKVVKRSAAKSNNYGVNYFLPKSVLTINAHISKVEMKAGPYHKYAEKYLGLTDVVTENKSFYELESLDVISNGIPDKDKSYLVELKSGTVAPFVYLTENGLICTINAEYAPEDNIEKKETTSFQTEKLNPEALFTEEYLQAGSTNKMAEVAAKQIYKIRESRMDILTGNSDNAPRDGVAMKLVLQQLEEQEKALVELFSGSSSKYTQTVKFEIEPKGEMDKEIVFRFSKYLGIVGVDDLSGVPVYMNLKKIESSDLNNSTTQTNKKDKSKDGKEGVVYNIPGQASTEVFYGVKSIYKGTIPITQFGTTQVLANPIFEDKKAPVKVYFYPETGGIKKIEQ